MKKTKIKKTILSVMISLTLCASTTVTAFASPPSLPSGNGGFGGADTMTYDYSGTLSASFTANGESKSASGEILSESESDVNTALAQNGGVLEISQSTLNKTGSDNDGDNCNFYGINSILLSTGEDSLAYISDSELNSDSTGSNGIFATDSGKVYSYNNTIQTTEDNSRGLDATYGGTIIADKTSITTQGEHCAAVATDRGGGNVSVTNSTFSTSGSGSPLIYSTGDIEVDNITGTSTGSQLVGMEGLNTVLIYNSDLSSEITDKTASDPVANGIIIYQSTSGDAESTTGEYATFNAVDSTLSSKIETGSMFYITNTSANVVLQNTTLNFDSDNVNLIQVEGNDSNNWGTQGSNGADVTFTGISQELYGDISVDTISTLNLYLLSSSTYEGAVSISENSVNTEQSEAPVTINIDSSSKWIVTDNSTLTNLNVEQGGQIVDENGKSVSVVVNGSDVINGDSDLTVTVTGDYSTTVSTDSRNLLETEYIDRTDFDNHYSTSTSFTSNGNKENVTESETTEIKLAEESDASSASVNPAWYILIVAILLLIVITAGATVKKNKSQE